MKKILKKYRSIVVMATALIFNLVSSLLVWHPKGQIFNATPMTVTEWICDIIGIIWFFIGFLMMFYDTHQNEKEKIKEAILETADELEEKGATLEMKTSKGEDN